jgi:signal transduction histidine kinase
LATKLYINRNVLWGLIASIAIILALGIVSYRYFLSLSASSQWANHARRVLQNVEEVRSSLLRVENAQRGFSLTGDESFLKSVDSNIKRLDDFVNDLATAIDDNESQRANIQQLAPMITRQIEATRRIIEARKVSFEKAAEELNVSHHTGLMRDIQLALDHIKEEEQSQILSRSLGVQKGFFRFVAAFIALVVVTVLVLCGLVWMINSNTRSRAIVEEKLREAELETQKINKDLESFSYSVSHDLRAPLRSINGYSQILIEDYADRLDAEGNRLLNVIISNAKKMGQLIDDLLEFSRLGRQEIYRAIVDVNEQVTNIANELVEREPNRKIELKIDPLGTAAIDPSMMRQVWINLIGNAIKYSKNKEAAIVEIGRREEKDNVVFFVKDNGAGFDMAYKDKLFGVFQRLHKNNEFEGTGVGLALVKRIIDRHGGQIWADAKVGEGATFFISLPRT